MDADHALATLQDLERDLAELLAEHRSLALRSQEIVKLLDEAQDLRATLQRYLTSRGVPIDYTEATVDTDRLDPIAALPPRSQRILEVLASGPRDWPLAAILDEMRRREWLSGLKNEREAVRVALDRMMPKHVVRTRPATYALRRRLADTGMPPHATRVVLSPGVVERAPEGQSP